MYQVSMFAGNVLLYFLFCAVSVLAGIGLMRLLGLHVGLGPAMAIAPVLTAVCWTLGLGIGVALRTPVSTLALVLWPLTGALIISNAIPSPLSRSWGIKSWASRWYQRWKVDSRSATVQLLEHFWPLAVCVLLPVGLLLRVFSGGLADSPGTPNPDSWSYVTEGQYLWGHARGDALNLVPLYMHGLRISDQRFISASLLGFFSPLYSAGETYATRGLFVSWCIFVFAGACAFFGMQRRISRWLLLVYVLIAVCSGWITNAVLSSNYDNLVALVYLPTFAGLIPLIDVRLRRWQLLLGGLAAGALYAYPEVAIFTGAGAILMFADQIIRERYVWRQWVMLIGGTIIVGAVLIAPFLPEMVRFFLNQTHQALIASGTGVRPGEGVFKGLVLLQYYPSAFWGLGGEHTDAFLSTWWIAAGNYAGMLITVLALLGFFRLIADRQIGLVATLMIFVAAAFVFILRNLYPYGAYKVILLGWWALCFSIVYGLEFLLRARFWRPAFRYATPVLGLLAAIGISALGQSPNIVMARVWSYYSPYATDSMAAIRQVQDVKTIIGKQPLHVIVDDWYASMWAVYFLRDTPIAYLEPRYYLQYVSLAQTMPDAQPSYILTDEQFKPTADLHWVLVWQKRPYRLWHTDGDWAIVAEVNSPNGVERHKDGGTFFWIGTEPVVLKILATKSGLTQLHAIYSRGPSVAGQARRSLRVTSQNGATRQIDVDGGEQSISVSIEAGLNKITLQAVDRPTVATLPNGDTRALVLGVQNLSVEFSSGQAVIEHIVNPNGLEQLEGQQFFWMGQGATSVAVWSAVAGTARLSARFVLGPSLPEVSTRKILVTTNHGHREVLTMTMGKQAIELPVSVGDTLITLTPLDTPVVERLSNGDLRPLLLGVEGLKLQIGESN